MTEDTNTGSAVVVEGMSKFFGDFQALYDIDLTVDYGERVVICGPSGSGKSTVARLLLRLRDPAGGRVLVDHCRWRLLWTDALWRAGSNTHTHTHKHKKRNTVGRGPLARGGPKQEEHKQRKHRKQTNKQEQNEALTLSHTCPDVTIPIVPML